MLCCHDLHHLTEPLRYPCIHPASLADFILLVDSYFGRNSEETLGLSSLRFSLSQLHADNHTPGPLPLRISFDFTVSIGLLPHFTGSTCILVSQVYPSAGLSQLYLSCVASRSCIIRFMLRPATLAGIPDWVRLPLRKAVGLLS